MAFCKNKSGLQLSKLEKSISTAKAETSHFVQFIWDAIAIHLSPVHSDISIENKSSSHCDARAKPFWLSILVLRKSTFTNIDIHTQAPPPSFASIAFTLYVISERRKATTKRAKAENFFRRKTLQFTFECWSGESQKSPNPKKLGKRV